MFEVGVSDPGHVQSCRKGNGPPLALDPILTVDIGEQINHLTSDQLTVILAHVMHGERMQRVARQ